MRIDIGFYFAVLLFLGDVFWIEAVKISQLGLLLIVCRIYLKNKVLTKKYVIPVVLIIGYNFILNISDFVSFGNSMAKIILFSLLLLAAFDMKRDTYNTLLSYYISIASFIVAIWWLQILAFIVSFNGPLNLDYIYDSSVWSDAGKLHMVGNLPRLNSFLSEPSYLGLFILPLFAFKLSSKNKTSSLVVLIPLLMTFSLNVYVGLAVLILSYVRWHYKSIIATFIIVISIMYLGINEYIFHRLSFDSDHVDVTLLIYILHVQVFLMDWKHYLFGYGFDNYYLLFQEWRENVRVTEIISIAKTMPDSDLMLKSSPLLILRLIVELGYVFFVILLFRLRKYLFKRSLWIYSLIGLSLRDGDYFRPFFIFFLIMHITNRDNNKCENNERSNAIHSLQS